MIMVRFNGEVMELRFDENRWNLDGIEIVKISGNYEICF